MSLYLTRREVQELMGTPIRLRQLRWLAANGWPHAVDSRGRVLIARAYHDKRLGVTAEPIAALALPATPPPLNLNAA
ncbi:DUF4224 domain-containing protein [Pandoraea cepalis]|uniref:DUF4224 domain-containing protein n=1 Tax=Pandoraea cepalis TaxID=2508294 RepID=UPI00263A656C|nr:DUF4224 domain-containing protein [Pandoraea cepalis]